MNYSKNLSDEQFQATLELLLLNKKTDADILKATKVTPERYQEVKKQVFATWLKEFRQITQELIKAETNAEIKHLARLAYESFQKSRKPQRVVYKNDVTGANGAPSQNEKITMGGSGDVQFLKILFELIKWKYEHLGAEDSVPSYLQSDRIMQALNNLDAEDEANGQSAF